MNICYFAKTVLHRTSQGFLIDLSFGRSFHLFFTKKLIEIDELYRLLRIRQGFRFFLSLILLQWLLNSKLASFFAQMSFQLVRIFRNFLHLLLPKVVDLKTNVVFSHQFFSPYCHLEHPLTLNNILAYQILHFFKIAHQLMSVHLWRCFCKYFQCSLLKFL